MKLNPRKIGFSLVTTALIGTTLLVPEAAFAAGSTTTTGAKHSASLATLQQKGEAAIDARLQFITNSNTGLQADVSKAKNLSPTHASQLSALLSSDVTGLTALRAKIAADTDIATARADDKSIVGNFRVYVLMGPQTHLTIAADNVTAAVTNETTAINNLETVVANLKQQGKDTTSIESQLSTAQADANAATAAVSGQANSLLALTPSGYPANETTRNSIHGSVKTGITDAQNAHKALKTARQDIKP